MRHLDLLIVGAGPAGCAAAVQARRLGLEPVLVDRTGRPGGLVHQAWQVENYPGLPPMSGAALVARLREHLERFEIQVESEVVTRVRPRKDALEATTSTGVVAARAVIAAVGTEPVPLEVPGADLVDYEVRPALERGPHRAVVIGSGEAGLDYALSLAHAGTRVTVLARGNGLRARGRLVELVRDHPEVDLATRSPVRAVRRAGARVEVEVAGPGGPWSWTADVVIAAIGRRSTLYALGLDGVSDGRVSTRWPGLHLVGDARTGSLGQVGMAVGDGLAAAMAVARELHR